MITSPKNNPKGFIMTMLFLVTMFGYGYQVAGQETNHIVIKGEVRDSVSRAPLAFVHIKVKGKSLGAPTNSEGKFALYLKTAGAEDSLIISHLGYVSKTVPVKTLLAKGFHSILLRENTIYLKGVVVQSLTAEGVVKAVAGRLKENFSTGPVGLEGFYRNSYKEIDTYVRQFQAAFSGFDANFLNRNGLTIGMLKKNISRDYRKFKWKQVEGNVPWHYLWKIRRQHKYFFTSGQHQKYDVEIEEMTSFEGEDVYKLKFVLKDSSERTTVSRAFIRASDYAVLEISGKTKIISPRKFKLGDSLVMAYTGSNIVVKYSSYQGKMYHSYSSSLYQHEVYDGASGLKGSFDMNEEMIIHEIKSPSTHKGKNDFKRALKARMLALPPDSVFWKQYNRPVETALSKAVKRDLEALEKSVK